MAQTIVARYRRWFEHEKDAHAKVVRSLESVPAERRAGAEFRRAISILAHLGVARRAWLGRLGAGPVYQGSFFPEGMELAQVAADWRDIENRWGEYLNHLTDNDIAKEFEYQSSDAGRFRNRIEDILAQLFSHAPYHRGQIAMLVRAAGGEPAVTDFIYWCREPVQ